MKTIDFGTSKTEIIKIAREIGAKYVIEWHDHYRGNAKGLYRTVDEFEKSNYFSWNEGMDDRGAVSVVLTDADVPTLIEERKEITLNLEYLRWLRERKVYKDATKMYGEKRAIDGRWSIKNPKYIEAKKHNDKINEFINEKRKEIDKEIKEQKDKLQQYNLVSSTMWHCELK